jgi:hypothetical protein
VSDRLLVLLLPLELETMILSRARLPVMVAFTVPPRTSSPPSLKEVIAGKLDL